MARIQRIITVCDMCQQEVDVTTYRVAGPTGNVRPTELCDPCQGKPFREVLGKVGATRTRGRRPGVTTPEALERLKADRRAAEAAATPTPTPRKRAARKVASKVKG